MFRDFRTVAFRILNDVFITRRWVRENIEANLRDIDAEKGDVKKVYELVYGILRNKNLIDYNLSVYLREPPADLRLMNVLRIGYYQLRRMSGIPPYAAINTCVQLAKTEVHFKTGGFVNGVLRNVERKAKKDPVIPETKQSEYFSIKYSYEPWMADMIMKEYGGDAERILAAGNQKPPVFLKVNDIKAGDTDIIKLLKKQGVEAEAVKPVKGCLFVKRGDAVRTDAHEQGMFYVQDLSSQILCGFISPSSKDAVIDVASAPGGKAANFAIAMKNRGQIIAVEPEKPRILLMEQNFVRLGITNVRILGLDATVDIPEFHGKGEKVLVDAPCSALGVIRRHPEKKWCIKEEELKEFPKLQLAILNTVKNWVKKGGALYYSTCTINPGENRAVIEKFLEKNREFRAVDICGKAVKFKEYKKGKYFLSLPGNKDNMDGFFMAKMVRGRT